MKQPSPLSKPLTDDNTFQSDNKAHEVDEEMD